MGILVGAEIETALQNGSIKIEPLDSSQVGPGSIDLTLGNDFRVFKKKSEVYHAENNFSGSILIDPFCNAVSISAQEQIPINRPLSLHSFRNTKA